MHLVYLPGLDGTAALRAPFVAKARACLDTLIVRSKHDRVVPRSASETLREAIPHATVADIEGPHLLLQANPHDALVRIATSATA